MSGTPAKCTNCGFEFLDQKEIRIQGAAAVSLSNIALSCPKCGGAAKMADGVFSYDQFGTPTIVQALPETHLLFDRIYKALRDAKPSRSDVEALLELAKARQSGTISEETAEASASSIDLNFGGLFSQTSATWLQTMITVLTLYLAILWRAEDQAQDAAKAADQARLLAVAEQQLELTMAMRQSLVALAASRTPPPKITRPPDGPRTKRQMRRDRKHKLSVAACSKRPASGKKQSKAPPPADITCRAENAETTKAAPVEPGRR
jgi:hypothetical protein